MDFISGQLFSMTNPIHRIPGHFVYKPQILMCNRALLTLFSPSQAKYRGGARLWQGSNCQFLSVLPHCNSMLAYLLITLNK